MEQSGYVDKLRNEYIELTNSILPDLALSRHFPVRFNHCFQRIILDNIFGCCWYDMLDRNGEPAYKQLNEQQLEHAVDIAKKIVAQPDNYIIDLNNKSLKWRGKR